MDVRTVSRRLVAASLVSTPLFLAAPAPVGAQRAVAEELTVPDLAGSAPTALASGDLDEDGRPDLVVATTAEGRHRVAVLPAAGPGAPGYFGEPIEHVETPFSAYWLATGDFDADGHVDLAAAARDGDAVAWFRGDGTGRLSGPSWVELSGALTAWASGEVNRRDGLEDLVMAVSSSDGPLLLVFEAAGGAFSEPAEAHALPAPAREIVLAQLDGEPWREIAVAAGEEVVVFEGRDRKTSLSAERRALVPPPRRERLVFDGSIESLSAADLVADALGRSELLVQVEGRGERVLQRRLVEGAPVVLRPAAARRMATAAANGRGALRSSPAPGERKLPELAPLTSPLTATGARASSAHPDWLEVADAGVRSVALEAALRPEALRDAVDHAVAVLPMRLGTDGTPDLVLASRHGLRAIVSKASATFTVNSTNDANDGTCDGTHCSLREAINAANATADADDIHFAIPGAGPHTIALPSALPAIIHPVTIDGYTQSGAAVSTDPTVFDGTVQIVLDGGATGAGTDGLTFSGSAAAGSRVRGLAIVGFPDAGILIFSDAVTVDGNLIGLLPDGSTVDPLGGTGVAIFSDGNTVGGTAPENRNVITGPEVFAILVFDSATNLIQGNLMGTDAGGTSNLSQTFFSGVMIQNSNDNTVGGTAAGAGNVIAGAGQAGLCFCNFDSTPPLSTGNLAQGNRIGTNAAGTGALPNTFVGLASQDAGGNTIGGTAAGAGNLISGNAQSGVFLSHFGVGPADDNVVQGNFIGTDVSGTAALPNGFDGVALFESASDNSIGGAAAGAGNILSGNIFDGVFLEFDAGTGAGVEGNTIEGNLIGTDPGGTLPLGNGAFGVEILDGVMNTVRGNTIAFSGSSGVFIESNDAAATDNLVTENVIAGNGFDGVSIYDDLSVRNRVSENQSFDNAALGIDLVDSALTLLGPNPNDADDPDGGVNALQNHPAFDALPPGATSLDGTLDSVPSSAFTVELFSVSACDPSGFGEAETFLGSVGVNTDPNGDGVFTFPLGGAVSEGDRFTATATDALGNTSELSSCRESCVEDRVLGAQTVSGTETVTACETVTAGSGGFEVGATGDLTIHAGQRIVLEDGFSVGSGGRLELRIDPWLSTPP